MLDLLKQRFSGKRTAILGFGREGQSTYSLIRQVLPDQLLLIADQSDEISKHPLLSNDNHIEFHTGKKYLDVLGKCELVMKSPGVRINHLDPVFPPEKVFSQTSLFMERYGRQIIGITGTKGKSTTASLIHHIFKLAGKDSCLVGNIGSPAFHFTSLIGENTLIVFELSSHQLEYIEASPHVAVLLNLFQEHLDAYASFEKYQQAKLNIALYQRKDDFLVYHSSDELLASHIRVKEIAAHLFPFSLSAQNKPGIFLKGNTVFFSDGHTDTAVWEADQKRYLKGEHNLKNIMAAIGVCCLTGISNDEIREGILTFKGLEHRLEYVGEYRQIHFYNDSIATIPEATIEAVKSLPNVDTLILGGFDRGIDYSGLAAFLKLSGVRTLVLAGAAGKRIGECMASGPPHQQTIFYINRFDALKEIVFRETRPGFACLLSPAAASYDEFANFEERGKRFRELVKS
ncbi:MAG: UDP-N-acetylmuramoyl-L-alanine--D-glutamate ligase [Bacteroidetes bacterium]|nr:UDP-N-acetylmuramoyl-L-alanine--D-glutamate ligase [Bacteroidota bacterium]